MHTTTSTSRRQFLTRSVRGTASLLAAAPALDLMAPALNLVASPPSARASKMKFGLVTYLWGRDWDLPTLIRNCEKSEVLGVELRTTHAHGVERSLNSGERKKVRQRFTDSPVELVGIGSNERFDDPDPAKLAAAIEATKDFVRLSHDVGGSGVKVKPNSFHENVPREKTIDQIGAALHTLGGYADGFGQEIRLEVHGQCSPLPIIRQIIDRADHPRVRVCWNSNAEDLKGKGLHHNFGLVMHRFGRTTHVRPLDWKNYPSQQLLELFVMIDYEGWILLEAGGTPEDRVAALIEQRRIFGSMVAKAQRKRWS